VVGREDDHRVVRTSRGPQRVCQTADEPIHLMHRPVVVRDAPRPIGIREQPTREVPELVEPADWE